MVLHFQEDRNALNCGTINCIIDYIRDFVTAAINVVILRTRHKKLENKIKEYYRNDLYFFKYIKKNSVVGVSGILS